MTKPYSRARWGDRLLRHVPCAGPSADLVTSSFCVAGKRTVPAPRHKEHGPCCTVGCQRDRRAALPGRRCPPVALSRVRRCHARGDAITDIGPIPLHSAGSSSRPAFAYRALTSTKRGDGGIGLASRPWRPGSAASRAAHGSGQLRPPRCPGPDASAPARGI